MLRSRRVLGMLGLMVGPILAASSLGAQTATPVAHAAVKPSQATAYKKELPSKLTAKAKITEAAASATALARVPDGHIKSVELEQENGKLLYSYDIGVSGKSGIDEVHVDAMTGLVLKVEHETPAMEKAEAAADKAGAKKKPPTPMV